jgi:uncharacterized protein
MEETMLINLYDKKILGLLSIAELMIMTSLVVFDILLPSLLIIAVGLGFLLLRKEKPLFFNNTTLNKPVGLILSMAGIAVLLTIFNYALLIPVLNRITGTSQSMGIFADLQGNTGLMLLLLGYSWVIAALGEEIAYRGFLRNRIISIFPKKKFGIVIAVVVTSVLFGLMHGEQGIAGMVNTCFDAVIFSIIRYKYKSIWASVLVHGFSNTIGILAFYFLGPLNGLW